jgi:glycogen operon protein
MNASIAMPTLQPGHCRVLGATLERNGVNFALIAPSATSVELCIFDRGGHTELHRLHMPGKLGGIWHGFLEHGVAGLVYGWRVHGPWDPEQGLRFNPNKLLLDPCAGEVVGHYGGEDIHVGHSLGQVHLPDARDNASLALKARVVADLPPLTQARPVIAPSRRVMYELHVKGFTALNLAIPEPLRGTYAGLAHPASVDYLKSLGITTLSLMPVAQRVDEARLLAAGLSNYWGYNPIAWNAPESRYSRHGRGDTGAPEYACGSVRLEFRAMVDALHAAGIEVLLDVVYNHTGETDEYGPTLSMRGIDNALYYHLNPNAPGTYANWTGCGNCINLTQPLVLRTVMDSLRGWVNEFGVDGFRFDLAPVLARGDAHQQHAFHAHAPFLSALAQDPVLRECTVVAEPWDIGPGGYRLGQFPSGWLEWNDRFRDSQRGLWLARQGTRGEVACRIAGSADVFDPASRPAHSSVNFITAHDGFTLQDLVSYLHRHNAANGENNRDGHGHNLSTNHGVEGPATDPRVVKSRNRDKRALLAMLMLSLGTPMLLAGDELGHSQAGNNNAYCQDNETTWLDWSNVDTDLLDYVRQLLQLRRALPTMQSANWWQNDDRHSGPVATWFDSQATRMTPTAWSDPHDHALAIVLKGSDTILWLINASREPVTFILPPGRWIRLVDSHAASFARTELASQQVLLPGSFWLATDTAHSLILNTSHRSV